MPQHPRTTILLAARQCFARHGFAKTSMENIARAVGMKAGSLYHYFDGKEAIFKEVVAIEVAEMLSWLTDRLATEPDPVRKVLEYTRGRLEYFRKVMNLLNISIDVVVETRPLVDRLYRDLFDGEVKFLASVIRKGVTEGTFAPCNCRMVARTIITVCEAVKFRAVHGADVLSVSDVDFRPVQREVGQIVDLILRGMLLKQGIRV